ncbi:SDR family NAD(P)-dependent oxidoreductase [Thermohalobacter berrensis]|uniref:3-ketoacyl-ACP reductase n=1 Tax=Thermohalobacter berrensis TaxID=99594 RepID=A0A419T7C6_9FIRM|nr:SDR family oxidoreductase [Thermohalobacter berrensis]RKD33464.1 hypothetical protein BET03_09440 [Thermohalobacter berrensis]
MKFKNKIVLVTGGANGIGKAIAKAYLDFGAKVIIADKDKEKGIKLEKDYNEKGYELFFYEIDLKQGNKIVEMIDFIVNKYDKIDILVNNAGISKSKSIYDLSIEEWDEILNVNLRSYFITSREFARHMRKKGGGCIINIASTRYLMSEPNWEAYAASKGGIVALTHALAITLGKEKIRVNSISPGWIQNDNYDKLRPIDHNQHPSKRVGKPQDIARACLFLSDENNDFINGENIVIDGGMTKKMIYEE